MPRPAETPASRFWRSAALPFVEAREVRRGEAACFQPHSHATFSIGAITGGRSTCLTGRRRQATGAGMVVVLNPEDMHACNPDPATPWAYRMLFLDVDWLSARLDDLGAPGGFPGYAARITTDRRLFTAVTRAVDGLTQDDDLQREEAVTAFVARLHARLGDRPLAPPPLPASLRRAADLITDRCAEPLTLAEIAAEAGLSPTQCVRAFRARFGLTPHAYLVNRRIQLGQRLLRAGRPIVDAALEAGFADQAHFQRTFKRLTATTPRQYRMAA